MVQEDEADSVVERWTAQPTRRPRDTVKSPPCECGSENCSSAKRLRTRIKGTEKPWRMKKTIRLARLVKSLEIITRLGVTRERNCDELEWDSH
jgi:hypothetical protein